MMETPTTTGPRVVLGVLGGLGPVASAEFVRTLYAHCSGAREQDFPAVVLRSDPSFDARSPAAMDDPDATLPDRFAGGVRALLAQGCTHVVVACMTLHHLLPRLPADLRHRVVSVVDVLIAAVAAAGPGPHLLLCSRDARAVGLYGRHPRWPEVASSVVLPSVPRNDDLHAAIMDIKVNRGHGAARRWLAAEVARYGTTSVVAGCSEIHVLAREWPGPPAYPSLTWIDPFDAIARATAAQDLASLARPAAPGAATPAVPPAAARPAGSGAR
jgi:aspartate racemase